VTRVKFDKNIIIWRLADELAILGIEAHLRSRCTFKETLARHENQIFAFLNQKTNSILKSTHPNNCLIEEMPIFPDVWAELRARDEPRLPSGTYRYKPMTSLEEIPTGEDIPRRVMSW
jgi:hypothetical protein